MKTASPFLRFENDLPIASSGIGGLVRDSFANGRLFASVGPHGGLVSIAYWGRQHLQAAQFFQGALETAWYKLFRLYVRVGKNRYYVALNETRLHPFGWESHCQVDSVEIDHDLILLPDALVQRFAVATNPKRLPIGIEMLHQDLGTATNRQSLNGPRRTWRDFTFDAGKNALLTSCLDENAVIYRGEDALAQQTLKMSVRDCPRATTWIGLGCDLPFDAHRGAEFGHKHYLASADLPGKRAAFFLVFATSRGGLETRLGELSRTVQAECDNLLKTYRKRLRSRPRIRTGRPVLDSALFQYPEMIEYMKVPDQAGAVRATLAGYFVWGWDGMMPLQSSLLCNEPEFAASILRFFQSKIHPKLGLPHQFTSRFGVKLRAPFPAQCQYIAGLYRYVAATGNLALAREVLPTCRFILERCRREEVGDTGLVSGSALWPDFPEAMEENGHDISSMNNSLLYQGLRAMEYLAGALDEKRLAAECRDWAGRLRVSFIAHLYDPEKGYFISSCSSVDFSPRSHYCCQAVFWLTPFAEELVSHDPGRIADFMHRHLRSDKCLLSLPMWDSAWMADGNQLGSSFPAADALYLNLQKMAGNTAAIAAWIGDVEWFWQHHTAPEAFTPEALNEAEFGVDNPGCKQLQTCATWYTCLYNGLAGLDFDHEGITWTPWGDAPIEIENFRMRGHTFNIRISGRGNHAAAILINGKPAVPGSHKIAWSDLKGRVVRLDLQRGSTPPRTPVILRANGLNVTVDKVAPQHFVARINGKMSGKIVVQASASARVRAGHTWLPTGRGTSLRITIVSFPGEGEMLLEILP